MTYCSTFIGMDGTHPTSNGRGGSSFLFYFITALVCFAVLIYLSSNRIIEMLLELRRKVAAAYLQRFSVQYNIVMAEHKCLLFSELKEVTQTHTFKLLEIGAGTGANFKYFLKGTNITCVEPNTGCEPYLRKNFAEMGEGKLELDLRVGKAEDMSFIESDSVDAVVCTLVLCSCNDVDKTLREIIRVLKRGGKFYFMEHVAAEKGTRMHKHQTRLAPYWYPVAECRLNQETLTHIAKAGFTRIDCQTLEVDELKNIKLWELSYVIPLMARHIIGSATK